MTIDLLAIDHASTSDRTTVPPARTISVPGSRRALARVATTNVTTAEGHRGQVFVPDWLGALLLKARAAVAVPGQRPKHLQDFALLLGLPQDITYWTGELAGRDRRHLRAAAQLLDDTPWRQVARAVDIRAGQAALALLTK